MKRTKAKGSGAQEDKKIALHYMKTLVDVARESFIILDAKINVISANPVFYSTFHVTPAQTEGKLLYKLGNDQWNILELKKLLEEVLPKKKVVKNYEVTHTFENIGERTMLLNAGQIDAVQLIILAIEDISDRKALEEKAKEYTKGLEDKVAERTKELGDQVKELESLNKSMVGRELKMIELKNEINEMKQQRTSGNGMRKNGNGKKGNGKRNNGSPRSSSGGASKGNHKNRRKK